MPQSISTATDPRPLFATAVRIATPVIAGVSPDQLGLPSPCVEYDVKGVLDHLVFVLHRVAKLCRGEEAFAPTSMADAELSTPPDMANTTRPGMRLHDDGPNPV